MENKLKFKFGWLNLLIAGSIAFNIFVSSLVGNTDALFAWIFGGLMFVAVVKLEHDLKKRSVEVSK